MDQRLEFCRLCFDEAVDSFLEESSRPFANIDDEGFDSRRKEQYIRLTWKAILLRATTATAQRDGFLLTSAALTMNIEYGVW